MKNFVKGLAFVALALVIIPLIPAIFSADSRRQPKSESPAVPAISNNIETKTFDFIDEVSVYDIVSGKVIVYSCGDYLRAAVMASVSPAAEKELLKTQTVLMYTYILGRRIDELAQPTPELQGCDISTDTNKYISLMSDDDAKLIYKENADEYISNVTAAVSEVMGEYISYNSKPIVPAYCFSCGGVTESALTVLGADVPYLKSVESEHDKDYTLEATYTQDELFARISLQSDGITLLSDPKDWISVKNATDSGYVLELLLDSKYTVSGQQFASWLNLPSARFTVSYSDEFQRFIFKISGNGHLVGLSQYGANEMAKNGYTYKSIIQHFFTGVSIQRSNIN